MIKVLPDVVLLDIDNTLYAYAPAHKAGLEKVSEYINKVMGIDHDDFLNYYDQARKHVHTNLKNTGSSHSRLLYFQRFIEISGNYDKLHLVSEFNEVYWDEFIKNIEIFEGVFEFLDYIKELKIPVVLVTDLTLDVQIKKITRLNLEGRFDFLVTSEEAGKDKPDRKIFDMALDKINKSLKTVWMIGDNVEKDIIGAKNIGAIGLLKCNDENSLKYEKADYKFLSFRELISMIKKIQEV